MVWRPTSDDKRVLDYWFDSIDKESVGIVGGARVVNFLKSTGLNRDILRTIWNLVDADQSGNVDRTQFYKLIRLTTVCCNIPLPKGYPSEKLYLDTIHQTFSLPNLSVSKDILNATTQTQQNPNMVLPTPSYYANPNHLNHQQQHPPQYDYTLQPTHHQQPSMPSHAAASYYQPQPNVGILLNPAAAVHPVNNYPMQFVVPIQQPVYNQQPSQPLLNTAHPQPAHVSAYPPHLQPHQQQPQVYPTSTPVVGGYHPNTSFQQHPSMPLIGQQSTSLPLQHQPYSQQPQHSQLPQPQQQQAWIQQNQSPSGKINNNPHLHNPTANSYYPQQQSYQQQPQQPNFTSVKNIATTIVDEEFSEFETAATAVVASITATTATTTSDDDFGMGDFVSATASADVNSCLSSSINNHHIGNESNSTMEKQLMEPSTPRHAPPPSAAGTVVESSTKPAAAMIDLTLLSSKFSLDMDSTSLVSTKQPQILPQQQQQQQHSVMMMMMMMMNGHTDNNNITSSLQPSANINITAPSTTSIAPIRPALNDNMRFLDDVIEMDLMVADNDQWDDFVTTDGGRDGDNGGGNIANDDNNNAPVDSNNPFTAYNDDGTVIGDPYQRRKLTTVPSATDSSSDEYDNGNNTSGYNNNSDYHPPEPSSTPPAFLTDDNINGDDNNSFNSNNFSSDMIGEIPPPPSYTPSLASIPADNNNYTDHNKIMNSSSVDDVDDDFGDFESSSKQEVDNNNVDSNNRNNNNNNNNNSISNIGIIKDNSVIPSIHTTASNNNGNIENNSNHDDDSFGDFETSFDDNKGDGKHIDDLNLSITTAVSATHDGQSTISDNNEIVMDVDVSTVVVEENVNEDEVVTSHHVNENSANENDDDDDETFNFDNQVKNEEAVDEDDKESTQVTSSSSSSAHIHIAAVIPTNTFTKLDISDAFSFDDDNAGLDVQLEPLPPLMMMMNNNNNSVSSIGENSSVKKTAKELLYDLTHITNPIPTPPIQSAVLPISNNNHNVNNNSADTHEDDDFGDFESHGNNSTVANNTSDAASINNNHANNDLFPPPTNQQQQQQHSFTAFPTTTKSTATTTTATAADLDFFAFGGNSHNNINSHSSATTTTSSSSFGDFDPFGSNDTNTSDNHSIIASSTINPSSSIQSKNITTKSMNINNNSNNHIKNNNNTKHLSATELDSLTTLLFDMHLYNQAYTCHLQSLIQHNIESYEHDKKLAVENDELELAVELKKKITQESKKLLSLEIENNWIDAVENSHNQSDDSLIEIVEIIESISKVMADKCRSKYLSHLPSFSSSSSTPLIEKLKFYVIAKRNIRLVMMLLTTHIHYPDYWKSLLMYVETVIQDANKRLIQFDSLNVKEQNIIIHSDIMQTYLAGLLQIAEIGMYVSATCIDAMVREKQANSVIQGITLFLESAAAPLFDIATTGKGNTRHLVPSVAELSDISYIISPDATIYCNLTLRPILNPNSSNNITTNGNEVKTTTLTNVSYIQNRSYHQGAINCWLTTLASPRLTPPASDDAFH